MISYYFKGEEKMKVMGYQSIFVSIGGALFSYLSGILANITWTYSYLSFFLALIIIILCIIYLPNDKLEKIDKTTLGFKKDKALIIIVMGSLGSLTMTKKLKETLPLFKNKVYQVLLITGKDYYDEYKDIKLSSNVKLVPFVDNLLGLMKDADLIVTRSGASTIAEITSIGLPAIMVPSPYVTNNHQYKKKGE